MLVQVALAHLQAVAALLSSVRMAEYGVTLLQLAEVGGLAKVVLLGLLPGKGAHGEAGMRVLAPRLALSAPVAALALLAAVQALSRAEGGAALCQHALELPTKAALYTQALHCPVAAVVEGTMEAVQEVMALAVQVAPFWITLTSPMATRRLILPLVRAQALPTPTTPMA